MITIGLLTDGIPLVVAVLLPVAGPDLLEVGHNVVTPENADIFSTPGFLLKVGHNVVTPKNADFYSTPEFQWSPLKM